MTVINPLTLRIAAKPAVQKPQTSQVRHPELFDQTFWEGFYGKPPHPTPSRRISKSWMMYALSQHTAKKQVHTRVFKNAPHISLTYGEIAGHLKALEPMARQYKKTGTLSSPGTLKELNAVRFFKQTLPHLIRQELRRKKIMAQTHHHDKNGVIIKPHHPQRVAS